MKMMKNTFLISRLFLLVWQWKIVLHFFNHQTVPLLFTTLMQKLFSPHELICTWIRSSANKMVQETQIYHHQTCNLFSSRTRLQKWFLFISFLVTTRWRNLNNRSHNYLRMRLCKRNKENSREKKLSQHGKII